MKWSVWDWRRGKAEVNQVDAVKEFTPASTVCMAVTTFFCCSRAKKLTQKEMTGGKKC